MPMMPHMYLTTSWNGLFAFIVAPYVLDQSGATGRDSNIEVAAMAFDLAVSQRPDLQR
jgi:hypothetical protein